mmetsp:Transcript_25178/g.46138  ORF Transcript_25178/g.46138 Transcript_25178/m.46138 type:complete len:513 (-) Transcript_25178:47-1585(-)
MHFACVLLWNVLVPAASLDLALRTRQHAHLYSFLAAETKSDPYCSGGFPQGAACCDVQCGKCGGSNCGKLPGGASACCDTNILKANVPCTGPLDASCVIPQDVGVCTDMVGSYTCTNANYGHTTTGSDTVGECHSKCKNNAGCVGGQFIDKGVGKSECSLFGVAKADANYGKECMEAVQDTTQQSYVFTCESPSWIGFSFKLAGVKYDALIAAQTIFDDLQGSMKDSIIARSDEFTNADNIQFAFKTDSTGAMLVEATVRAITMSGTEVLRTHMSDVIKLQAALAAAVGRVSNIATVTDGTYEVTDFTQATSEEAPSIDLASIVARFGSLQQQISELSTLLVSLEEGVDSVSSEANASSKAVQDSLAAMNHTVQAAIRNRDLAGQLNTQAANVTDMVASAMEEVQRVQGVLNKMEGAVTGMDQETTNLTSRLDSLKLDASLLLPDGKGGLLARLKADETLLAQHWEGIKDTQAVDANITANLRANFRRSKGIVQNVTQELQANLSAQLPFTT